MEDITAAFREACQSALGLGELIRHETFQLQDAITALEIMDPKMDNGVIDPQETVLGAFDCSQILTPDQVLSILDQLLASEMAWQNGASLAQTLYTCVYVQALLGLRLEHRNVDLYKAHVHPLHEQVLLPYVAATMRGCEFVRQEFLSGRLYDEEDVSGYDFDEKMLCLEPVETIETLLDRGIAWCASQHYEQLRLRLSKRKVMLQLSSQLENHVALLHHTKELEVLLEQMEVIPCTLSPTMLASIFNPHLQRRFASSTPPRPIITMSVDAAVTYLKQLCLDMGPLSVLTGPYRSSPTAMHAFLEAQRRRVQPYLPLTRSLMQNHFSATTPTGPDGILSASPFLIRAMAELMGPRQEYFDERLAQVERPSDKGFRIHSLISTFLQRLEPPVLDLFRIYWHNPSRQRRNLCKSLLDLDVLQGEAELVDTELAGLVGEKPRRLSNGRTSLAYTLSSWLFNLKLDTGVKVWFMGFEQDLYRPWELDLVYLQLEHLLALQLDHLTTLYLDRVLEKEHVVRDHLESVILYDEVLITLCKSFVDVVRLLKRHGCIQQDGCAPSSRALLYEYRMKPFNLLVSPPAMTWQEARACLDCTDMTTEQLQSTAIESVVLARQKAAAAMKQSISPLLTGMPELWTHRQAEVKAMVATGIANNLFLSRLGQIGKGGAPFGKVEIKFPFSRHFPVFALQG